MDQAKHSREERRHTVPVATAIVWSTTFSCGLIGVGKSFETRYPIRADWRDILYEHGADCQRTRGR